MLTDILRTKATIQTKTAVTGPVGQSVSWANVGSYWCRRISVDVATRIAYMQNNTVVTDKFIFNGELELLLGQHQIIHGGKTYELAESAQHIEGNTTVLVREI